MRVCNSCNQTIANPIQVVLSRRESSREYICGSCVKRAHADAVGNHPTDDVPTTDVEGIYLDNLGIELEPTPAHVTWSHTRNMFAYAVLLHGVSPELLTEVPALFATRELAEAYAQEELSDYRWNILQVVIHTT